MCVDLQLEKELTYENFVEWTRPDMMDNVEVRVGLPRFKMEEKYDLKEVLIGMGMPDAFDASRCDFSGRAPLPYVLLRCRTRPTACVFSYKVSSTGMSPGNDLFLSQVVHKAFVDVNEEGTEAAAATGAVMNMRCAPMRPAAFIADHPFLFFIRHNPSKSILFAGRFCSPQ